MLIFLKLIEENPMKTVCVYLGANFGNNNHFSEAAILLGKELAKMDLTLVYGGSSLGMMGLLATTVKEHGGKIIGIITKQLIEREKPLNLLDELHIVDTMQERKKMMQQMADVFIVMPGGLGTLEEAFETWSAIKIGGLEKSIGFLNIDGYFDGLFSFIGTCEQSGLLLKKDRDIPVIQSRVESLLAKMITPQKGVNKTNNMSMGAV
ncbi:TIGR00730 family Rossman fold protein [Legionella spiritensis]|uniref:LOG family protein n=1 Tax=Legionella spiritensis TaxID=452 RepID=UPI001E4B08FB|nr:TIGR00730 family Rossman fold protein [Legionella spiritensis]